MPRVSARAGTRCLREQAAGARPGGQRRRASACDLTVRGPARGVLGRSIDDDRHRHHDQRDPPAAARSIGAAARAARAHRAVGAVRRAGRRFQRGSDGDHASARVAPRRGRGRAARSGSGRDDHQRAAVARSRRRRACRARGDASAAPATPRPGDGDAPAARCHDRRPPRFAPSAAVPPAAHAALFAEPPRLAPAPPPAPRRRRWPRRRRLLAFGALAAGAWVILGGAARHRGPHPDGRIVGVRAVDAPPRPPRLVPDGADRPVAAPVRPVEAADALAAGRWEDALPRYLRLAADHPGNRAYRITAAVLARQLDERCRAGGNPTCRPSTSP